MSNIVPSNSQSIVSGGAFEQFARAADNFARMNVFEEYRQEQAKNTLRRKAAECDVYAAFLRVFAVQSGSDEIHAVADAIAQFGRGLVDNKLPLQAEVWCGTTFGLVKAFRQWLLDQGYAIGTVNNRVSTVKSFCKLAFEAGCLEEGQYLQISGISGIGYKKSVRIDENREAHGKATRVGSKKATATVFSTQIALKLMKDHPDTPQGRRDAVIMTLLLEHGLRVSEVAGLKVSDIHLDEGWFAVYRKKTSTSQKLLFSELSADAMRAYIHSGDAPAMGYLLRSSRKDGSLTTSGMTTNAINALVGKHGKRLAKGVNDPLHKLSPHDCRHYFATDAGAQESNGVDVIQKSGGWASTAMAVRYMNERNFANEGLTLSTGKIKKQKRAVAE